MRRYPILVTASLFALALFAATSHAQEWTRFRGPNGSGISSATTIPVKWTESDYNWRVTLPGEGHGSPVIWGDRIFLMCASEDSADRFVVCLSTKDGHVLWQKTAPTQKYKHHRFNSFGSATPAVDKDRVYAYWTSQQEAILAAYDHDGNEKWKVNLGAFDSSHGGGTSPMLVGDKVIIANDQQGDSYLIALSAADGKPVWKVPRKSVKNGTAYAVACLYSPEGDKPQLIFNSRADGMAGVDPESGRVLWQIEDAFPLRVVASPIVIGDLVTGNCGEGGGGTRYILVRPGSFDGSRKPELVRELAKPIPYVPTSITDGRYLYYINDGGHATCIDPKSGDIVWQERLGEDFFGSPVIVNNVIYVMSRTGEGHCYTLKTGDKFEVIAKMPLGEMTHATPAVSGGRMYLRTNSHLISIGGKSVN